MTLSSLIQTMHSSFAYDLSIYDFTIEFFNHLLNASKNERRNPLLTYQPNSVIKFYKGKLNISQTKLKAIRNLIDKDCFINYLSSFNDYQIDLIIKALIAENYVIDDFDSYESITNIIISMINDLIN